MRSSDPRASRGVRVLLLCALVALPPTALAGAQLRASIGGLGARLDADRAIVSFHVDHGLPAETIERIHAGIEVTFKHRVDVVALRWFPIPDKTLARTLIKTRAGYDSLTGRYSLLRSIEFKTARKGAIAPRQERRSTDSVDEMRRWMTEFEEVPVYDPARLLEGRKLRVRVRSELGRRYLLLIFPSTIDARADCSLEP